MTFKEWMDGRNVAQVAVDAGVSLPTVYRCMAGLPVQYSSAKALASVTDGAITVIQLCEGDHERGAENG